MIQGLILDIKYGLKRGEWWYFQMAVPKRLQPVYGCALLKEATGTKDDIRAAQIIAALAHRFKKEFELIETGQLKAPKALDQAAKTLLKKWGLAAHSVHNDQTLEEVFIGTLHDKDEKGLEISPAELRAAQLLSPIKKDKTDILLSEMPNIYLEHHPKPTPELEGELERTTRYLIESIGTDIPYKELTRDHLNQFRDDLSEIRQNATGTVKRRIAILSAMFKGVSQEREINKPNPAENIRIRNIGKDAKKRLPLKDHELDKINLKLDLTYETDLAIRLMFETTGRINEIIGLEKADLYLDVPIPYVAIRPNSNRDLKTKVSTRNVPIVNPETLQALKDYLKADTSRSKDLFPRWATNPDGAGKVVKTFFNKLGIDATAHYTRHTLAAQLRKSGCEGWLRCLIGGWTSPEGASSGYGEIELLELKAEALKKALAVKLGN